MRHTKTAHDSHPRARVVARLVRQLLHEQQFSSLADLTDALKWKCAQMRVRLTPDDITTAFAWIATNTRLVHDDATAATTAPTDNHPCSRAEAAAILARLGIEL